MVLHHSLFLVEKGGVAIIYVGIFGTESILVCVN